MQVIMICRDSRHNRFCLRRVIQVSNVENLFLSVMAIYSRTGNILILFMINMCRKGLAQERNGQNVVCCY